MESASPCSGHPPAGLALWGTMNTSMPFQWVAELCILYNTDVRSLTEVRKFGPGEFAGFWIITNTGVGFLIIAMWYMLQRHTYIVALFAGFVSTLALVPMVFILDESRYNFFLWVSMVFVNTGFPGKFSQLSCITSWSVVHSLLSNFDQLCGLGFY